MRRYGFRRFPVAGNAVLVLLFAGVATLGTTDPSAAAPLLLGAMGDSITDEYGAKFPVNGSPGQFDQNWVELFRTIHSADVVIFDNAVSGAQSNTLLSQGQHTATRNQFLNASIEAAVLIIGGNDFAFRYFDDLFHNSLEPTPYVNEVVANIRTAILTVLEAGDVPLVIATPPDITRTPIFASLTAPQPAKRQNLRDAIRRTRDGVVALGAEFNLPVIDLYQATIDVTSNPLVMDGTAQTRLFAIDGFHPSTLTQGLLGNLVLYGLEHSLNEDLSALRLSDQQILAAASLPHTDQTSFFDIGRYVIVPEPSTFALAMVGLLVVCLGTARRCPKRRPWPSRGLVTGLLTLAWLGAAAPARAIDLSELVFDIDPSRSVLNGTARVQFLDFLIEGDLSTQPSAGLGTPGFSDGLSAQVDGFLKATINHVHQEIRFEGGGNWPIDLLPSGIWLPGPTAGAIQAPADLAAFADLEPIVGAAGTAVAAIRDALLLFQSDGDLSLTPTGSGSATFESSLQLSVHRAIADYHGLSGLGTLLGQGSHLVSNTAPSINAGAAGSLVTLPNNRRELTVPIDLELSLPVGNLSVVGNVAVAFHFTGQIVGVEAKGSLVEWPELEPNNAVSAAQDLDGLFALRFHPDVNDTLINTSTTVPHVTILGTGDGTFDYYSFTVTEPNSRGFFDIDYGATNPGFVNSMLTLFGEDGTLLSSNGDFTFSSFNFGRDTGSSNNFDAYLEYRFTEPGRYVIRVGGALGGPVLPLATYMLHVSLENAVLVPEPSGLVLGLLGFACCLIAWRKRHPVSGVLASGVLLWRRPGCWAARIRQVLARRVAQR